MLLLAKRAADMSSAGAARAMMLAYARYA